MGIFLILIVMFDPNCRFGIILFFGDNNSVHEIQWDDWDEHPILGVIILPFWGQWDDPLDAQSGAHCEQKQASHSHPVFPFFVVSLLCRNAYQTIRSGCYNSESPNESF